MREKEGEGRRKGEEGKKGRKQGGGREKKKKRTVKFVFHVIQTIRSLTREVS